jgi:uncharacterized protein YcbK (DUF882 family)
MSKHFINAEFACKCGCGTNKIRTEFITRLDHARDRASVPFVITSGYRCPDHNRRVGGVPDSAHAHGWAADIVFRNGHDGFLILEALLNVGFTRVGIDSKRKFIHVDADPSKPAQVIWGY